MKRKVWPFVFFFLPVLVFPQEVLRGAIVVDLEPIYGFVVDEEYPLSADAAYRRVLEEAALFFSAQIYGWSFHYDIGERARDIDEELALEPEGEIRWGDPALRVTHASFLENKLEAWIDYRPRESQLNRLRAWRASQNRTAQGTGFCDPGTPEASAWFDIRKTALEDAARAALREILRGSERNRPKQAHGYISLQTFPRYFVSGGRWVCSARFLVDIQEIVPFAVY